jgi:hypothetical protein
MAVIPIKCSFIAPNETVEKNLGSKNVQKNLPQQAKKLPKCCGEHQNA